jgi:hypothetical protein
LIPTNRTDFGVRPCPAIRTRIVSPSAIPAIGFPPLRFAIRAFQK